MCRDHPRVRGEHTVATAACRPPTGSSPRARGAPGGRQRVSLAAGIIPACAGSTASATVRPMTVRDHPRVRGEHSWSFSAVALRIGSSPRARGAQWLAVQHVGDGGIIPACAGSTAQPRPAHGCGRDHPRVRGEHVPAVGEVGHGLGSSPRARGALDFTLRRGSRFGIIPACAGSTYTLRYENGQWRGSSPRARGARPSTRAPGGRVGIIPACAGSTLRLQRFVLPVGDHPRVRGEHGRGRHRGQVGAGSSPRARGAPSWRLEPKMEIGIIPACAGSTKTARPPSACGRDHPRVRGEHSRMQ